MKVLIILFGIVVLQKMLKNLSLDDFYKEHKQIKVVDVLWMDLDILTTEQFGLFLTILY